MARIPQVFNLLKNAQRSFASAAAASAKPRKVAVLGAAGGIGQPLSMLMKVRVQVVLTEGGCIGGRVEGVMPTKRRYNARAPSTARITRAQRRPTYLSARGRGGRAARA